MIKIDIKPTIMVEGHPYHIEGAYLYHDEEDGELVLFPCYKRAELDAQVNQDVKHPTCKAETDQVPAARWRGKPNARGKEQQEG